MAMDIIEKDKKEIRWTGLPAHGTLQKQLSMLQRRNIELRAIVDAERRVVQERLKKQRLLRGLIHRNMSRDSVIGTADDSGDGSNKAGRLRLRIPLIVLRSTKDVEMRVESNIEEGIYLVSSTRPFEILQDLDILDMLMNPKTRSYVDANAQVESIPAVPSTQAMGLPGHAQSGSGMPYVIPQHHYARSQRAMPTHMFQATHPVQASPQYQHLQQFQRFHPHQYQQFDDIQNQFHGQVPNKQSRPYHPDYYRNMMTANPNNATMYPDYVPAGAVRPESSSLTLPLPSAFGYASHPASPGFLQGHADELLSFPHPLKKEGE
ncbi:hypothetical protein BC832DRAFT_555315 [Gaertneriomyces semiglobifer]|nr:hypothetical protein BC832DRAFT_555315 [Gaertneriomyces semiglobifer]